METQGEEAKLQFLVSGSYEALPSSYLKLRSYLNFHSLKLAKVHGLKLPKCISKRILTCSECLLPWSCNICSIKLLPVKKCKKKFAKVDSNSKVLKNCLVLKCKICNSNSRFYLPKIAKTVKTVQQNQKTDERKVKKKKKKDKKAKLCKSSNTSMKNFESCIDSINKTKSSASKPSKSANTTADISRNVKQVNLKNKNSKLAKKTKQPIKKRSCDISHKAGKVQGQLSMKNNRNLEKIKKLVQEHRQPVKKTLKDFLTLI